MARPNENISIESRQKRPKREKSNSKKENPTFIYATLRSRGNGKEHREQKNGGVVFDLKLAVDNQIED
ncbi:hypothetical protein SLEP1_g47170 [Rubroshorea leprosula]|uniref:Uncharacterized protein n=1 Tax=Rubroshorea leprosula TaxID=152421 RepID=A0AAV5LSC1_9ROSI|nr:hypothetical protein SLEP1_g47170 [Rubroshorea leprosula]